MWLSKLDALTAGQRLALGDFRAVAARCMSGSDLREIEMDSGTGPAPDNAPITQYCNQIGKAMREKFPLPNVAAMPKLRWDPKQSPREFLSESKDLWVKHTGQGKEDPSW